MIAGKYFGQVADAATRMSKNGNPQMIIEFEVTHISEGVNGLCWIRPLIDESISRCLTRRGHIRLRSCCSWDGMPT